MNNIDSYRRIWLMSNSEIDEVILELEYLQQADAILGKSFGETYYTVFQTSIDALRIIKEKRDLLEL